MTQRAPPIPIWRLAHITTCPDGKSTRTNFPLLPVYTLDILPYAKLNEDDYLHMN